MLKKHKSTFVYIILCLCSLGIVLSSFILPDLLLKKKVSKDTNKIIVAPESYYVESGNAIARNASSSLSSLDQIKLISGVWERQEYICSNQEGFLTENDAVALARYNLNLLYDAGLFPYSANATYNNWCSWSAKLYGYTDTVFSTYSAYLWIITFVKFDNSATYTVYMTETGVILGATTNDTEFKPNSISTICTEEAVSSVFKDNNIKLIEEKPAQNNTVIFAVYPETDFSNVTFDDVHILDLVSQGGELESYYIYQYSNESIYGIGISPCTNAN